MKSEMILRELKHFTNDSVSALLRKKKIDCDISSIQQNIDFLMNEYQIYIFVTSITLFERHVHPKTFNRG